MNALIIPGFLTDRAQLQVVFHFNNNNNNNLLHKVVDYCMNQSETCCKRPVCFTMSYFLCLCHSSHPVFQNSRQAINDVKLSSFCRTYP